jgi:Uma2 family endonuclease
MAPKPDEPHHFFSLDEYFSLEHAGEARYEYWDGDIVCMSGGSRQHAQIASNVLYRLRLRLEGGPCRAFTGDIAVKTPTLLPYRYPDATVGCGELQFENIWWIDALINPVLIVEVLSPSTAIHDRDYKFPAYKAIAGFKEYLLVAQDAPKITHHFQKPEGVWAREEVTDLESALRLDSISCILPASEIYEGVTFASN